MMPSEFFFCGKPHFILYSTTHTHNSFKYFHESYYIYISDPFIQSDLQVLYMSEVARLWSN